MIIKPKIRGFICTSAHPVGCEENVRRQIEYVKSKPKMDAPKKVLVIGASMGYGLASRIAAAYSCGASTIGVIFDRAGKDNKTGTAGWYNTAAFEKFARADGIYAKTLNGDAFSQEMKRETIELIKKDLGKVDMVIYSLAAPKRTDKEGVTHSSVIKAIGETYTNKSIDPAKKTLNEVTVPAASDDEIAATVKVMGGEDWKDWIELLSKEGALAENAVTAAYSYIGPKLTHPMYFNGTIGRAKEHLFNTAKEITAEYDGVKAYIAVNKALVTQSSSAIPVVPLYIAILFKVMKEKGLHEDCIEQMHRLFDEKKLYSAPVTDENGLIRLDDWEMREDIQTEVSKIWEQVTSENLSAVTDIDGYSHDFESLFGFGVNGVDYEQDVEV
ncbi:MAG: trans-2-enoyl-CoA reductase family protein [Oscillospiraceae bacterium]|nr:trans-2-enoyl-CoA reductase family protein [Oscillospiraceae bacterium]